MRKWISILTCIALAFAFLQAPFLHDHEHEENNGHPGAVFHSHFKHLEEASSTHQIRAIDPDDDAREQQWVSAPATPHFEIAMAMPISVISLDRSTESKPFADREIESGHDPPRLTQTAPRAPPV